MLGVGWEGSEGRGYRQYYLSELIRFSFISETIKLPQNHLSLTIDSFLPFPNLMGCIHPVGHQLN